MAVTGLVLALLLPLVGLIVSLVALSATGPGKKAGRGLAVAGVIVSGASLLLFVIVVVALVASGAQNDSPAAVPDAAPAPATSADSNETSAPDTSPATRPATVEQPSAEPGPGVPVRDGEFTYTVTGTENPGRVVGEDFMKMEAQGEFVVVYVTVTNTGSEARSFDTWNQYLYDDQGREFVTSNALMALSESDADGPFTTVINPGNTVTDIPLMYDVAPGTVLSRIDLYESEYAEGATVSLLQAAGPQ